MENEIIQQWVCPNCGDTIERSEYEPPSECHCGTEYREGSISYQT